MPLLDLVCIGCWEVVFGAIELGLEGAVANGRLDVSGGRISVLGNVGVSLDVKPKGSLSYLGTEERSVGIGS